MSLLDDLKRDFWGLIAVLVIGTVFAGTTGGIILLLTKASPPQTDVCRITVYQATSAVVAEKGCNLEVTYKP